ncbi:hypothetical protein E2P30_00400 [Candidatus Bathyarchaeota archaeon]|nr:hypothetical protein E2P30_00400 [Candidatus Bathyarchaeota archaeon]
MAFEDSTTIMVVVALVVIIACVIVIYAMRLRRKQPEKMVTAAQAEPTRTGLPFKVTKSVQTNDASHAKDELRILDLEREILSDSIRRLYEAHAEGKISEQERERLAASYKSRMQAVKESMAKDETIVALHELEGMQEDLMNLFSERFGDLSLKVEELRSKIDVQPVKEIRVKMPKAELFEEAEEEEAEKKTVKKRRKPAEKSSPKSEAEKRIEEIRSEVEKVLDKLGQMEIES